MADPVLTQVGAKVAQRAAGDLTTQIYEDLKYLGKEGLSGLHVWIKEWWELGGPFTPDSGPCDPNAAFMNIYYNYGASVALAMAQRGITVCGKKYAMDCPPYHTFNGWDPETGEAVCVPPHALDPNVHEPAFTVIPGRKPRPRRPKKPKHPPFPTMTPWSQQPEPAPPSPPKKRRERIRKRKRKSNVPDCPS